MLGFFLLTSVKKNSKYENLKHIFGTLKKFYEKIVNYMFVYLFGLYNFYIKFILIQLHFKNYKKKTVRTYF